MTVLDGVLPEDGKLLPVGDKLSTHHYFSYRNNVRRRDKKAGIFFYDTQHKKTLLVRSKMGLWGPPKGTCERTESITACAQREVNEETGIHVPMSLILRSSKFIVHGCTLYLIRVNDYHDFTPIVRTDVCGGNDVDANGWFRIDDVRDLSLNSYARRLLDSFFPVFASDTSNANTESDESIESLSSPLNWVELSNSANRTYNSNSTRV